MRNHTFFTKIIALILCFLVFSSNCAPPPSSFFGLLTASEMESAATLLEEVFPTWKQVLVYPELQVMLGDVLQTFTQAGHATPAFGPTGIINTIKAMIAPGGQFTRQTFIDVIARNLSEIRTTGVWRAVSKVFSAVEEAGVAVEEVAGEVVSVLGVEGAAVVEGIAGLEAEEALGILIAVLIL